MTFRVFPKAVRHLLLAGAVLVSAAAIWAASPPEVLRPHDMDEAIVMLADGTWKKLYVGKDGRGSAVTSKDGGKTWSDPETPRARWASKAFVDRDGQLHGFYIALRQHQKGRRIAIDRFLDVWHFKTSGPDKTWGEARVIQEGWNGSIVDNAVQMANGRIVQPSQDWVPGSKPEPPTGNGYALMLYSDDGGETWSRSNPITSPVTTEYNGANFGACEPSVIIRDDGTLWALMRTQTGFLYESSSKDGAHWSEGKASSLHSSTGPPALVKMPDKRLLVFWNNCAMPPRVDGQGVYAGRDVLHAAISEDDGKTWRGFREVVLDPKRHASPPKKGDRGVAYPYAYVSADGKHAEITVGHAPGRVVMKIDPDWLLETERKEDFSNGLDAWSVFKGFGPAERWWRDRVPGATLIAHPERPGAHVLHVRHPDEKDADGAVWNFPAGHSGSLALRVRFVRGHGGARISLTDRFFEPTDLQVNDQAVYGLTILPEGRLEDSSYVFPDDKWVDLELRWNDEKRRCEVLADGVAVASLPQRNPSSHGASYLHLRSTAETVDPAGFQLESVAARVKEDRRRSPY